LDWAQLPAELLSLVVGYASLRALLHLTLVDRRLYRLLRESSSNASSHNSVWRHYPSATFDVAERMVGCAVRQRVVNVCGEQFSYEDRGSEFVASLLLPLHHIPALHVVFHRSGAPYRLRYAPVGLQSATFNSLQRFTQLRSLEVRDLNFIAANSLAPALDSLPSLSHLELNFHPVQAGEALTASLHRLCSTQLDHLTTDRALLYLLLYCQQRAAMPHLRSMTVFEGSMYMKGEGRNAIQAARPPFIAQFPSLAHLTLRCQRFVHELRGIQLPHLSSLTVHTQSSTVANFTHIHTRAFHLRCCGTNDNQYVRAMARDVLTRAPRMQQLAISDGSDVWNGTAGISSIFPPATGTPSPLFQLVYLESLAGLSVADWTYLLTTSSPPVFAAQLTHFALGVHWQHRAAVAALLHTLPSMYPLLTHVHIGVYHTGNEQLAGCSEWDAAVQTVKTALGAVWRDSADEVVACREDVAWKRSVGLPA